jgi:uncharacterized protein YndB with AHSA1/START domain
VKGNQEVAFMSDRIEKSIDIAAPVERVWRALTDHEEFGTWFRVRLDGPFAAGKTSTGRITLPGFDHIRWHAEVVRMDPPGSFAFTWHPYAIDPDTDYSDEPPTLVEFRLEPNGGGTRLTVTESGFDALPAHRRDEAFRMNEGGWAAQVGNIAAHVGG